jgi:hypothetical protein
MKRRMSRQCSTSSSKRRSMPPSPSQEMSAPDKQTLTEEVAAWEHARNKKHVKADWQFTTADARVKLKRLYPAM